MPSPIPPDIPVIGKRSDVALSPPVKIFAAATTLLIGFAVALVFWKTSVEQQENPLLDRQLIAAPRPGEPSSPYPEIDDKAVLEIAEKKEESDVRLSLHLPVGKPMPAADAGHEKYAQNYPPPILPGEVKPRKSAVRKTGEASSEIEPEKNFMNVKPTFETIHRSSEKPPQTKRPQNDFFERPKSVSSIEMKDDLLPYFHSVENLKPLGKPENDARREPENPFQDTLPTIEPPADPRGTLKPLLRISEAPPSRLLPLRSPE